MAFRSNHSNSPRKRRSGASCFNSNPIFNYQTINSQNQPSSHSSFLITYSLTLVNEGGRKCLKIKIALLYEKSSTFKILLRLSTSGINLVLLFEKFQFITLEALANSTDSTFSLSFFSLSLESPHRRFKMAVTTRRWLHWSTEDRRRYVDTLYAKAVPLHRMVKPSAQFFEIAAKGGLVSILLLLVSSVWEAKRAARNYPEAANLHDSRSHHEATKRQIKSGFLFTNCVKGSGPSLSSEISFIYD